MLDFKNIPPVVKNLLIINGLFYLATIILKGQGIDLGNLLGLHYWLSESFMPHQLVTYMFMHSSSDFTHVLFNMFAVYMFGKVLEGVWGSKRFLIYYKNDIFSGQKFGRFSPDLCLQPRGSHWNNVATYDVARYPLIQVVC